MSYEVKVTSLNLFPLPLCGHVKKKILRFIRDYRVGWQQILKGIFCFLVGT
jgi:hypothetical protein